MWLEGLDLPAGILMSYHVVALKGGPVVDTELPVLLSGLKVAWQSSHMKRRGVKRMNIATVSKPGEVYLNERNRKNGSTVKSGDFLEKMA